MTTILEMLNILAANISRFTVSKSTQTIKEGYKSEGKYAKPYPCLQLFHNRMEK